MVLFCCCSNYAIVGHISIYIFDFIALSVIIAYHSVLIPHKTHFPISSLNESELELN